MYSNKTTYRLKTIQNKKKDLLNKMLEEVNILQDKGITLDSELLSLSEEAYGNMSPKEFVESYQKLKEEKSDANFLERIQDRIDQLPTTNGGRYYKPFNLNIGMIADEFLYYSYKDAANMIYINRENYKNHNLDVFIVASAWKGLDLTWKGLGNPNNTKLREELYAIISYYRNKGTKIVFYSKEDPTNYDVFVDIAKHCDYIFTTAKEKVNDYIEACNNDKVYALEFGFNPIYNNPVGMKQEEKLDGAIFAGSWYEKYPHRQKDTRVIFDGILAAKKGLKIIDRNYYLNLKKHFFPRSYITHLSPAIEHQTLQKVFKLYDWVINLNSVQKSETMFANRVYELQAMGNLILSNYSLGINNLFPNIFMIDSANEVSDIMNNVEEKELYMHQMQGVRAVMKEHTTFHRLNYLLQQIGYEDNFISEGTVAVVLEKENVVARQSFDRQTYKNKTMVVSPEYLKEHYASFDYVTFFNSDYEYGEYYLEDLINGFKYTDSSYITKDAYYNQEEYQTGVEHNFVSRIKDKCKTLFDTNDFTADELLELEHPIERENGYSIDSLELDVNPVKDRVHEDELKLSVIIPVYNNGPHLYGKCFMSLRRSSIFKHMDIILVDDGSTDAFTLQMVDRLERLYPNIQTYKFSDNGSGSASRPRNKGLEMAKTSYITYLDPDNEAVNDSYAYLLEEMETNPDLDLVVGDIVKYDTERKVMNYSKNAFKWDPSGEVEQTRPYLHDSVLRAQSIQALIVKKHIITDNNLKMVENAVGQDTLFFQQLILNCKKFKAVDRIIHIYYAAVSTSVTNSISKRFFEKYLILEKERYAFLQEEELLDLYIEERFHSYFIGWYLKRVPRLKMDEAEDSLNVLYQIYDIYRKKLTEKQPIIEMFEKCIKKGSYEEFINYCNVHFSIERVKNNKSKAIV